MSNIIFLPISRTAVCSNTTCDEAATSCCSGCNSEYYCGPVCQRAHWSSHKPLCTAIKEVQTGNRQTHCHACSIALTSEQIGIQECSGCRFAAYCSVDCQRSHWHIHEHMCETIGKAVLTFQIACAESGSRLAMRNVGMAFEDGHAGVTKDAHEAVKWYQRAAELGLASAQSSLGRAFLLGKGVAKNMQTGFRWLHLAAAQGDTDAIHWLSIVKRPTVLEMD